VIAGCGESGESRVSTEWRATVAAVVVHWCNTARTKTCVDRLLQMPADLLDRIVLFDNGSPDGSGIYLKKAYQSSSRVRVVLKRTNLGFGSGVNEAIKHISDPRPDFVLLVNPDVRLPSETLEKMRKVAQSDPKIGAVGPTIVYEKSGQIVWQTGAEFNRGLARIVDRYKGRSIDAINIEEPKPVQFLTGAVVLIRTSAFEAVGGFDRAYFLYEEDLDLSFRLRSAGFRLIWVPKAIAYHDIAITDRYRPQILYHRARSRVIFLQKHFVRPYLWYALAIHFVVFTAVHGVRSLRFQRSLRPVWQWLRGSIDGLREAGAKKLL